MIGAKEDVKQQIDACLDKRFVKI